MAAMAVYTVSQSPGSAPGTQAMRMNGKRYSSLFLKLVFIPLAKLIPGMSQTPETAARRYIQASGFEPTCLGSSLRRRLASSPARLRPCAFPTSTTATTKKPRGGPLCASQAWTCPRNAATAVPHRRGSVAAMAPRRTPSKPTMRT